MSDDWLRVMPEDPNFAPASGEIARSVAEALSGAVVTCDEVTVEIHESPVFYDAGDNWEGVRCPACGADLEDVWTDTMSAAHDSGDLSWNVPCCGVRTNLNDLSYGWPCGFARFAASVRNPEKPVSQETIDRIAALLGAPVRVVRQHL